MKNNEIAKSLVEGTDDLNFDELKDKFDSSGLEKHITELLGFKPEGLKIEFKKYDYGHTRGMGVFVITDNLIDKCGIMNQVMESVNIDTGNYSTKLREGRPISWNIVDFSWKHIKGGSNGHEWFTSWYNHDTKEWTFRGQNE